MGNRAYQYLFKRNKEGKLDENGIYLESSLTKTSFKFPEQARFSFGVASVLPIGKTKPVGRRCPMFDYTGKNICTREVYTKHMVEECNRVKKLTGQCLPWFVDPRPKDEVWLEDSVTRLRGAGGANGQKLVAAGIFTVADMKG